VRQLALAQRAAGGEDLGASGAVDRAVDPAAAEQARVGGVDDRLGRLLRDVPCSHDDVHIRSPSSGGCFARRFGGSVRSPASTVDGGTPRSTAAGPLAPASQRTGFYPGARTLTDSSASRPPAPGPVPPPLPAC